MLDFPISDIWIIKKDRVRGRPWCQVINHVTPDNNLTVVYFEDNDVQPNDFYWVVIKQKGQVLNSNDNNEYMAFLGPFFIEKMVIQ